jgi:hypothetical protein
VRRRGPVLPKDVARRVSGRPLAFAEAAGTWLVGTRAELVMVGPDDERRIPWERVEGADWDRELSRLRVTEVGEFGRPRPSYVFVLDDGEPALLLQLIRERVTASVVLQRGVLISGKRGLKVIGRRSPVGGPVTWMHEYDDGIDPDDPEVASAAETLLRQAREDVGDQGDPI